MMVFASVFIFPPAFNRLVFAFDLPPQLTNISFLLVMAVIPMYDWRIEGRLTFASKFAIALLLINIVSMIAATAFTGALAKT
jgi:hypothetical protein